LRIAIVVRSLKIGGMERVAVNLAESFLENEHEAHLIYFKNKNKAFSPNKGVKLHHFDLEKGLQLTIIGIFLHIFSKWFNILFRRTYFFWQGLFLAPVFKYKLWRLERTYGKFDLIIIRGHGTFEFTWPLRDKRIVQMIESMFIQTSNKLARFNIKCLYTNKHLACVSSGVEEEVHKVLNKLNIKTRSVNVITNPIDINSIKKSSKEFIPNISEKYIVNVGRLEHNKNQPLLIDAYHYAKNHLNLKHKLVLIGDGNYRKRIEEQIKDLNLENDIILLGFLSNPYPWLKYADLFAFTSHAEGLGYVLLEALACETKVISTNGRGGIKDVMKDELSIYLSNFDKVEFAQKMMLALNDDKKINFEAALEDFSPKNIINKYIRTYLSK